MDRLGPAIPPAALKTFARQARRRMRTESGGYRRDHLRALAQRVEVDAKEIRIMGAKSALLRTLVAASSAKTAGFGVPSSVPKWRARHDSNVVTFAFGGSRLSLMTRGILRTFGLAVRPTVGEFIAHDSKVPVGGHITLANFNALSASCPSPPAVAFGVKRTSIGR